MNIGELRAWLKTQPRDREVAGIEERHALEAVGKALPEFNAFIAQLTLGAVMRLDPERMWPTLNDVNTKDLVELLNDKDYILTTGELLEAISRFKLTRDLNDDYELFDEESLAHKLRAIMENMETIDFEKSLKFRRIVEVLEDMRDSWV